MQFNHKYFRLEKNNFRDKKITKETIEICNGCNYPFVYYFAILRFCK